MRIPRALAFGALASAVLARPLGAQDLEPGALGLQARISLPLGNMRDALGDLKLPGLGGSIYGEMDLGEGRRIRLAVGADLWSRGEELPGEDHEIQAFHISLDGVYYLRDEGPLPVLGPYVVGGIGAYAWSMGKDVTGTGTTRRVTHAAGTLGFGWRLARNLEMEFRFLAGVLDPGLTATALSGTVGFRF